MCLAVGFLSRDSIIRKAKELLPVTKSFHNKYKELLFDAEKCIVKSLLKEHKNQEEKKKNKKQKVMIAKAKFEFEETVRMQYPKLLKNRNWK